MRTRSADDDELMTAISEGDETAFAELMQRHRRWVRGLVCAFVRDSQQAEDVTQEVFARVHLSAGNYTRQGSFIAWLKRVAVNRAKDHLRRNRQAELTAEREREFVQETDVAFDPSEALLSNALKDDLRAAIQTLPDEQRMTLIMRFFGDMSVQDIAWALRCPEGTIKSRIFHGLRRVREELTRQWEHEGD